MNTDKRVRKQVRKVHKATRELIANLNENDGELSEVTLTYAGERLAEVMSYLNHLFGTVSTRPEEKE
jgi:hypothetical protein